MRFDVAESLTHPLERVFRVHRDDLEQVSRFLEEVDRVECRSATRHATGTVEQVHLWYGSPKVLPVLIRPLVPANLLQWRQRTWWDPIAHTARWEIDVPGLGTAVESRGTNRYSAIDGGTRIEIDGEFWFRPDRVEALAAAVPASTVPLVEKAVVGLIVPLVKRTGTAVSRFLDGRDSG